jgi:hypothetical protein
MGDTQAQKLTLIVAAVVTTVAIVRVGVLPAAAPRPGGLNPALLSSLRPTGWTIRSPFAANDSMEVSTADGFELINPQQHPGVVVSVVPVRARGANSYTIDTLLKPVLGRSPEQTTLLRFGTNQRIRFSDADRQRGEAACINAGTALANEHRLVRSELARGATATLRQRLEQIAGLRPVRQWDCLLVVVRQPNGANTSRIWSELLSTLGSWDRAQS